MMRGLGAGAVSGQALISRQRLEAEYQGGRTASHHHVLHGPSPDAFVFSVASTMVPSLHLPRVIDGCLVCVGGFCFPVSDQSLLPEKLFIIAGEAEDRRLLSH